MKKKSDIDKTNKSSKTNELLKVNESSKTKQKIKLGIIILSIIIMCIYEFGVCNGNFTQNLLQGNMVQYHFSLCRLVIYIIFLGVEIKWIHKLIPNDISKTKKIVLILYSLFTVAISIYVLFRWTSIYRISSMIVTLLLGIIFLICISANYTKNLIVTVLTIGLVFCFCTNFHHPLDEKKHFMSALNLSFGNFQYVQKPLNEPEYNNIIFNCDMDDFAQFFEKKYEPQLTEEWDRTPETEVYYICSTPADYNFILYIPATLGILVARILGGSVADIYIMARLFNLLAYLGLCLIALKILPIKKKIFYVIYMLPISILLAASCSIDGMCIGLIGIFIAYCINLWQKDITQIGLRQILTVIGLFAISLLAKNLAYFAIGFFIFTLPIIKILKQNKKHIPILIAIIAIALMIVGGMAVTKINQVSSAPTGDIRGGDTSSTRQVAFLLENPTNILKVGFAHIMDSLLNYNWYTYLNQSDFFGKYYAQIFFLELVFLLYVAFTDRSEQIDTRRKVISIITFLLVYGSTSLMLYLTFTPVGSLSVSGYQTRYLLPILPILLVTMSQNKQKELEQEQQEKMDFNISWIYGLITILDIMCLIIKV